MPSRFSRASSVLATASGRILNKMPKMKTKASAKKRFRLTASGKVRANFAYKNHMLRRRSQKMKRTARGTMLLGRSDARIVKSYMPYG
jgi:large subunit ribosomal protein L35